MNTKKNYLLGIFDDEDILLDSIKNIRSNGIKIHEVYSPFPVHGIEEALGYRRTRLSIVAFLFGFLGTTLALVMQIGMMGVDWPMNIGGKDFIPLPAFIPVTFELTVLLASFGMVFTFLIISNLKPWGKPKLFDKRCTDDKHIMVIDLSINKMNDNEITSLLKENGALEINKKIC